MKLKNTFFVTIIFIAIIFPVKAVCSQSGEKDVSFRTTGETGILKASEDYFALMYITQEILVKDFSLALSAPVKFYITHNTPKTSKAVRAEDWDEPSDYARIIPFAKYNFQSDSLKMNIHFGELNSFSLGHGAIISNYFNSTHMDNYHGGLTIELEKSKNGIFAMTEDIINPKLFAFKIFSAPFSFFSGNKWAEKFELGAILVLDRGLSYRVIDRESSVWATGGGEISLVLADTPNFKMTPYIDVMFMDGDAGLHAGTSISIFLNQNKTSEIFLKGEYRRVGGDYHPSLVNPFYQHTKRNFIKDSVSGSYLTLADHLSLPENDYYERSFSSSNAFMVNAAIKWTEKLKLEGKYDTEGNKRPKWLFLRAEIEPLEGYSLHLFYASRSESGKKELFTLDALTSLSFSGKIWGPLFAFFEITRRWRSESSQNGFENEISSGIGLSFIY